MNNKKMLYILIGLSAISACCQYVIQGTLATGGQPSSFPALFLFADSALWGARALIEAAVIAYLFQSVPNGKVQAAVIGVFEFALIAMITLTVGPALRAMGLGLPIRETLTPELFTAWNFGIAGYTSVMIGAAGYAYRVQSQSIQPAQPKAQAKPAKGEMTALQQAMLSAWQADPLASNANVARLVSCDPATVGRQLTKLQKQGVIRVNGSGVEVVP